MSDEVNTEETSAAVAPASATATLSTETPPVDNDHVAEECEKFDAPLEPAASAEEPAETSNTASAPTDASEASTEPAEAPNVPAPAASEEVVDAPSKSLALTEQHKAHGNRIAEALEAVLKVVAEGGVVAEEFLDDAYVAFCGDIKAMAEFIKSKL